MSEPTQPELDAQISKLLGLLHPLAKSDVVQRAQAFVFNKKGIKISAYFSGPDSIADKMALANELIEILEKKEYDKLPAASNGQAQAAPAAAPTTPTPAPKPTPPPTPKPKPTPVPVAPAPEPEAETEDEDEDPDVAAAAAALKAALERKNAKAGLTAEQVNAQIAKAVEAFINSEALAELIDERVDARLKELFAKLGL